MITVDNKPHNVRLVHYSTFFTKERIEHMKTYPPMFKLHTLLQSNLDDLSPYYFASSYLTFAHIVNVLQDEVEAGTLDITDMKSVYLRIRELMKQFIYTCIHPWMSTGDYEYSAARKFIALLLYFDDLDEYAQMPSKREYKSQTHEEIEAIWVARDIKFEKDLEKLKNEQP